MESTFSFDFEDFTDSEESAPIQSPKYDKITTETYRVKRLLKIDPITDEIVPISHAFFYPHKWDPYTGEITGKDEVGPLVFNAINLYKYYFKNRFLGLWIPPTTEGREHYQGYYGNHLGAGKNIKIGSRGEHPEKYLFRIPVIDCYLPPSHNLSVITMGPLLSDSEINQIDNIISCNIRYTIPLKTIKEWYDGAIDNNLNIEELRNKYNNLNTYSDTELKDYHNRLFVNKLINCKEITYY